MQAPEDSGVPIVMKFEASSAGVRFGPIVANASVAFQAQDLCWCWLGVSFLVTELVQDESIFSRFRVCGKSKCLSLSNGTSSVWSGM